MHTFSPELVTVLVRRCRHPQPSVSLPRQVSDANASRAATAESVPEETRDQRPARQRQEKLAKLLQVKRSKEEQPESVEKAAVPKTERADREPNKEVRAQPELERSGPDTLWCLIGLKLLCLHLYVAGLRLVIAWC